MSQEHVQDEQRTSAQAESTETTQPSRGAIWAERVMKAVIIVMALRLYLMILDG